jgi:hypothetical protein
LLALSEAQIRTTVIDKFQYATISQMLKRLTEFVQAMPIMGVQLGEMIIEGIDIVEGKLLTNAPAVRN